MNKRKSIVVEHAAALFLEKGIQNTSIQDIIERSGISKGTFYNYFSSKYECVSAILELIRYEAGLSRSELSIGKDPADMELLIEQISILTRINEKKGLHTLIEEIFHSGDKELKRLVLQYRLSEFEWLAERLVEVFGEELRPFAFEGAVLFYGMLKNLLLIGRITQQSSFIHTNGAASVLHYMRFIANALIHDQKAVLDPEMMMLLKGNLHYERVDKSEVLLLLDELLASPSITKAQLDLTRALRDEIEREPLREAVISALIQPFYESMKHSSNYQLAKEIVSVTWLYVKKQ